MEKAPSHKDKPTSCFIIWLYSCCAMIFVMAVVGAITRLTDSGLSMVEWRPLLGWIPPLNDTEWQRVYELYKQSPEFEHKHNWMALNDFKSIFFWEWFHRLIGRSIGLIYALPLLWFWVKKEIPKGYIWSLLVIFLLGGAQGLLGWYMVQSGLVDRPSVSHFRLAAHLALALLIFSSIWWVACSLKDKKPPLAFGKPFLRTHGWSSLALLAITIIWGAFTAGLDAGQIYTSFPLMNGSFLPPENYAPHGFLTQAAFVQFTHRWLAVTTGLILLIYSWRTQDKPLIVMILIQIALGISTLLSGAWVGLAAAHQAGAIILLALLLGNLNAGRLKQ